MDMILLLPFYLVGVVFTLFMGGKILLACFSKRVRGDFERHPYFHLFLLGFVAVFWLAPWGGPLGYLGGKMDATHRFFLHRTPFSRWETTTRIAYDRILRDRYGIQCATPSCFFLTSHDINFNNAYDEVMRGAILKHYGRDVLAECEQAARDETGVPAS